jgi:hypothetical protein
MFPTKFLTNLRNKFLTKLPTKFRVKMAGKYYTLFHAIGFFNEAVTLESSSILIYSHLRQEIIYTEGWVEY